MSIENITLKICEKLPLNFTIYEKNGFCQKANESCKYCFQSSKETYLCKKKTYVLNNKFSLSNF